MAKSKQEKLEAQLKKEQVKEERKQEKIEAKLEKKESKRKSIKPKSQGGKKFLVVLLWVFISLIFVYGVLAIFNREDSNSIKKQISGYYSEISSSRQLESDVAAFAENFVTDYYTKKDEEGEYSKRIKKYIASGLQIEAPQTYMEVISAKTLSSDIKEDFSEVVVSAKIKFFIQKGNTDKYNTKIKTLNIVVPVRTDKKGNFAVVALPYYKPSVNVPSKIKAHEAKESLSEEQDTEKKECTTLAKNFFKAYYGTKASQLKYYVTDNYGVVATLGNSIEFSEIEEIRISNEKNGWKVDADISIKNSGIEEKQHFVLHVVKGSEDRLYVDKITTI